MKAFLNLPRNLRLLFRFLQGLVLIAVLLRLIVCLVCPLFHVTIPGFETIAQVSLKPDPGVLHLTSSIPDAVEVSLLDVTGTLVGKTDYQSGAFAALLRWQFFLRQLVDFGFCFLLLEILGRLCANVEKGDIFSARNIQLIRNLGLAILIAQATDFGARLWYARVSEQLVKQYVVLEGIQVRAYAFAGWFSPSGSLILTGCLVLMLAEVFRQGLSLKSENDLTV